MGTRQFLGEAADEHAPTATRPPVDRVDLEAHIGVPGSGQLRAGVRADDDQAAVERVVDREFQRRALGLPRSSGFWSDDEPWPPLPGWPRLGAGWPAPTRGGELTSARRLGFIPPIPPSGMATNRSQRRRPCHPMSRADRAERPLGSRRKRRTASRPTSWPTTRSPVDPSDRIFRLWFLGTVHGLRGRPHPRAGPARARALIGDDRPPRPQSRHCWSRPACVPRRSWRRSSPVGDGTSALTASRESARAWGA